MLAVSSLLIVLLVLLAFSAFFSASEAALIALNKVRLRHHMEQKKRGAFRVWRLVSRMDKLIATILVGNSLVNGAVAGISTLIFSRLIGNEGMGLVIATVVSTVVIVVFGELTPKVMATNHPDGTAFLFRHVMDFLIFLFSPITNFLILLSNGMIRLLGGNPHARSPLVTEEEMRMMITIGKEEGFYGDGERKMLERIFHFDEIEVRDVMTPFKDVTSVPVGIAQEELEQILLEEGHNRIPVYRDSPDTIIGILYVRDLLYLFKNSSLIRIEDLLSQPYFVPPTKKVNELLREFQSRKIQIAIVRDPKTEKALGLVTLEDLIEEIVGEIEEIDTSLK
ncbi:MAG TPA: CNNM domain-containing protein [Candidatus Eisenbacteria bacterium]|nr:CNNM domain-containing protein [Candidatus Eisenbacteria bacterium]